MECLYKLYLFLQKEEAQWSDDMDLHIVASAVAVVVIIKILGRTAEHAVVEFAAGFQLTEAQARECSATTRYSL